jgi:L-threonylcarbamoyladenylate synthase
MFFSAEAAQDALADLGPKTRSAVDWFLPGAVLFILPGNKGIRIPRLEGPLEPLARVRSAVVQTSANLTGGPEPRTLSEVPEALRSGADFVLDGGELPGVASTVVDLRGYEGDGTWEILREGAVPGDELNIALRS